MNRPLEGVAAAWVALWEARWKACEVLALDQPSGLRPDDPGDGAGSYATRTACFGFRKLCHGLDPARGACGLVSVIELGLPAPDSFAPESPAHWIVEGPELPRHDWSASKLTKGGSPSAPAAWACPGRRYWRPSGPSRPARGW
ncbi:MAG: hypothetical protein IPL96_11440 [Holophagaceae bacterium]|nr:hypothetical protein [Holophagaceae bacterium]